MPLHINTEFFFDLENAQQVGADTAETMVTFSIPPATRMTRPWRLGLRIIDVLAEAESPTSRRSNSSNRNGSSLVILNKFALEGMAA